MYFFIVLYFEAEGERSERSAGVFLGQIAIGAVSFSGISWSGSCFLLFHRVAKIVARWVRWASR